MEFEGEKERITCTLNVTESIKSFVFTKSYFHVPKVLIIEGDGNCEITNKTVTGFDLSAPDTNGRTVKTVIIE